MKSTRSSSAMANWDCHRTSGTCRPFPVGKRAVSGGLAANQPAYTTPEWWRDAKFGAWAHWDPQSMPEQGDWYARGMYQEGSRPNTNTRSSISALRRQYGYKDIAHNWVIDRWDPEELMDLYVANGGEIFRGHGRAS